MKVQLLAPLALLGLLLLGGCAGPARVSATEFRQRYSEAGMLQSMSSVDYLGVLNERAYIKIGSRRIIGGGWKERVIYIPLAEVDEPFRAELRQRPPTPP